MVNIDSDVVEYFSMHNVIYKRSLLKNMDYIQTEGISYTDQEWIFYPMLKADSAVFFNFISLSIYIGKRGTNNGLGYSLSQYRNDREYCNADVNSVNGLQE